MTEYAGFEEFVVARRDAQSRELVELTGWSPGAGKPPR